jgi:hypothetical protein
MNRMPYFSTTALVQLIMRLEPHAEATVITLIAAAWVLFIVKAMKGGKLTWL